MCTRGYALNTALHFAIQHCIALIFVFGADMIVYRELSSVESDLGFSASELYALSNSIDRQYRVAKLPKSDGTYRTLSVPSVKLKAVQHAIAEKILAHIPISKYATAYRYGASVQKNARVHVGKAKVLKLDIYHFFDSIRYQQLKDKVFTPDRFSEPIRILLSMLCYYRDVLPQGSPTSPSITNIIMREFDDTVGAFCRERGIAYTRYCDDMTFSGKFDHAEVINFVKNELHQMGFLINAKKTKVVAASNRQTVTGIVVNKKLAATAEYRRAIRSEVYYIKKYGIAEHLKHMKNTLTPSKYLQSLLGKIAFALEAAPSDSYLVEAKKFIISELKKEP